MANSPRPPIRGDGSQLLENHGDVWVSARGVHDKYAHGLDPSDVTHFYKNMASSRPFTIAFHIGEMLEGVDRLLELA